MSLPVERHAPCSRCHQTRYGTGERALAGAVHAQDRQDGSGQDLERHAEQGLRGAVPDVETFHAQEGLGHASPSPSGPPTDAAPDGELTADRWLQLTVAEVGGTNLGIVADRFRAAHGDPLPEVEDDDRIRQCQDRSDIVLDDDDRELVVALGDDPPGRQKGGSPTHPCPIRRGARRAAGHAAHWPGHGPPRRAVRHPAGAPPPGPWPPG